MSRANRQIWEDVFEVFRCREHPLVYKPESDGAIFCIIVLGRMALDCGTFIGLLVVKATRCTKTGIRYTEVEAPGTLTMRYFMNEWPGEGPTTSLCKTRTICSRIAEYMFISC